MVSGVSPLNAKEFEMSVYWGKLEMDATSQDNSDDTIVLIYALNSKAMPSAGVASNLKTGLCCVPLARVKALHEDLMSTLELAENDLQPTPQASTPTGTLHAQLIVYSSLLLSSLQSLLLFLRLLLLFLLFFVYYVLTYRQQKQAKLI